MYKLIIFLKFLNTLNHVSKSWKDCCFQKLLSCALTEALICLKCFVKGLEQKLKLDNIMAKGRSCFSQSNLTEVNLYQ